MLIGGDQGWANYRTKVIDYYKAALLRQILAFNEGVWHYIWMILCVWLIADIGSVEFWSWN